MDKLPYYKAKSQYIRKYGSDAAKRDFAKKIALNTLMAETKHCFEIESDFALRSLIRKWVAF
jgi:hypothetical protein